MKYLGMFENGSKKKKSLRKSNAIYYAINI